MQTETRLRPVGPKWIAEEIADVMMDAGASLDGRAGDMPIALPSAWSLLGLILGGPSLPAANVEAAAECERVIRRTCAPLTADRLLRSVNLHLGTSPRLRRVAMRFRGNLHAPGVN